MATLTIRNLPETTHKGLRLRAAENGRSVEEVRRILAEQVGARASRLDRKSANEIAAAVKRAQELFAPMRKSYSVDQFVAEKRAEARKEQVEPNDAPKKFRR